MKVMILAGGYGSRISEESVIRPKPLVEIGEMPILWHIMKIYSAHGLNEFIICCGYKGHMIKEWFSNYHSRFADVTFDLRENSVEVHSSRADPWRVTLVDTGDGTMTGGRIKRAAKYLEDAPFCLTYGDGVGNVDITKTIDFHKEHGKQATMTIVQPDARFGMISLEEDEEKISSFREKPKGEGVWANAGFFVLDPSCVDLIENDATSWEVGPLQKLAENEHLMANRHTGFWMPMDTLRDKNVLEEHWASGQAPWKVW